MVSWSVVRRRDVKVVRAVRTGIVVRAWLIMDYTISGVVVRRWVVKLARLVCMYGDYWCIALRRKEMKSTA